MSACTPFGVLCGTSLTWPIFLRLSKFTRTSWYLSYGTYAWSECCHLAHDMYYVIAIKCFACVINVVSLILDKDIWYVMTPCLVAAFCLYLIASEYEEQKLNLQTMSTKSCCRYLCFRVTLNPTCSGGKNGCGHVVCIVAWPNAAVWTLEFWLFMIVCKSRHKECGR